VFPTAIHFHRSLIWAGNAGAYWSEAPSVTLHSKCEANTLAYYDLAKITAVKRINEEVKRFVTPTTSGVESIAENLISVR